MPFNLRTAGSDHPHSTVGNEVDNNSQLLLTPSEHENKAITVTG